MITGLAKFWKMFRRTVRGVDSSRQLALGVTFGMFVGMLPKDSLFAYAFGLLMLLSTANLLCGAISGFAFSWIGMATDAYSHSIGKWVLTNEQLEPTWAYLYQLPVVPWTRFENTVVMGALILALVIAVPLYLVSRSLFDRYGDALKRVLTSNRLMKWLIGPPNERLQET